MEVISKAIEREQKAEYTKAAFIGYQTYLCAPKDKKTRVIGFDKWLKSLGLEHKKKEKAPTQEEIERARKNAERIMAMDREKFKAERKRHRRREHHGDRDGDIQTLGDN